MEQADVVKMGKGWAWVSALFAAAVCMLWSFLAFRAFFETPKALELCKQFGAKLPLVSQLWNWAHESIGAGACVLVVVAVVKEAFPIGLPWKMAINAWLLFLGCVMSAFAHWALSAPMLAVMQSLMGGPSQ